MRSSKGRPVTWYLLIVGMLLATVSPASAQDAGGALSYREPDVLWVRQFGGAGNDTAACVMPLAGGGYAIAGSTFSGGRGDQDIYLIKADADGHELWDARLGGPGNDGCNGAIRSSEGGYLVTGYTGPAGNGSTDLYIVKADPNGSVIWAKAFGSPGDDAGFSAVEVADGYVVAGNIMPASGGSDAYLVKVGRDGSLAWERTYGEAGDTRIYSLCAAPEGGFVLAGVSQSSAGGQEFYAARVDASGNLVWQLTYGLPNNGQSGANVVLAAGTGYVLNGWASIPWEGREVRTLFIGPDGSVQADYLYGSDDEDYPDAMILAEDGDYLVTGHGVGWETGEKKVYVIKGSFETGRTWVKRIVFSPDDTATSACLAPGDCFLLAGSTLSADGDTDIWLAKLGRDPIKPVAAVVAGTGLGLLGLLLGRMGWLAAIWDKAAVSFKDMASVIEKLLPLDALNDFIEGYAKTQAKSMLFKKESEIEKLKARERVPFLAGFSSLELLVTLVGSLLLGVAYIFAKGMSLLDPGIVLLYMVIAGLAMGLHDLMHRYAAWRYRALAEYRFWPLGSLIMLLTAIFLGVAYAVPAKTVINDPGKLDRKAQAVIYLAGPLMSFAVALAFLALVPLGGGFRAVGLIGASMNMLSAVYSLMPFDPMDGSKVVRWQRMIWAAVFLPLFLAYLALTVYLF
jgi:Zn-dependent protease